MKIENIKVDEDVMVRRAITNTKWARHNVLKKITKDHPAMIDCDCHWTILDLYRRGELILKRS